MAMTTPVSDRKPRRARTALVVSAALAIASVGVGVSTGSTTLALPTAASESSAVTIDPTRVLDSRVDVGLTGAFVSPTPRKLQITGTIETYIEATKTRAQLEVVPTGATGVLLNVTATAPTLGGFLSVRPGDATGVPSTSSLNFVAGDTVPNSVIVALPQTGANAGKIDITYVSGTTTATVDVIIDVVGYLTSNELAAIDGRLTALEQMPATPALQQHGARRVLGNYAFSGLADVSRPSLTIAPNGQPVIAYDRNTNDGLGLAFCDDSTCSFATPTSADGPMNSGESPSATIGSNGHPIVAHRDATNGELRVSGCIDNGCAAGTTLAVPGTSGAGWYPSITIDVDGFPLIAHENVVPTTTQIALTACTDLDCQTATTKDLTPGTAPRLTIGVDGFPVIAHAGPSFTGVWVTRCKDATCQAISTTEVDANGFLPDIAIGVDGNPILAYQTSSGSDLVVTHCGDVSCTTSTRTVADTIGTSGLGAAIIIQPNGLPVIAHEDNTNGALRITWCNDVACTTSATDMVDDDPTEDWGESPSIAIGTDGNVIVSHLGPSSGDVRVVHVSYAAWTPNGWD